MEVVKKIEIDCEDQRAINRVISMMTEILNDAELCSVDDAEIYAEEARFNLEHLQDECFVCFE